MELEKIVDALEEIEGMIDEAAGESKHRHWQKQLKTAKDNCRGASRMVREAMRTLAELAKRSDSAGGNSMELEKIVDALKEAEAMIDEAAGESKNNHLKQQLKMAGSNCRGASSVIREVMRILAELAKQSDSA